MKPIVLAILAAVISCVSADAAAPLYNNVNGVHTFFPPTPAPQIDAVNFLNQNEFFITNFVSQNLGPPPPYRTQSTLNWTNRSFMKGDSGFEFMFVDPTAILNPYKPSANFVNGPSVNDSNATIFGATYMTVAATNIVNRGALTVGDAGIAKIAGQNVDLSRSTVAAVGGSFNPNSGIQDAYWGTNVDINPAFFSQLEVEVFSIATMIQDIFYVTFFVDIDLRSTFTTHRAIGVFADGSLAVDFLFLNQTNSRISSEVRFTDSFDGAIKTVQWSAVATNHVTGVPATNFLYMEDIQSLLSRIPEPPDNPFWPVPLIQRTQPNIFYSLLSAATFFPFNFTITRGYPNWNFMTPIPATVLNPADLQGTNLVDFVTNSVYGARILPTSYAPDPSIQNSGWTNVPGRVEISAGKVLDLNRTRIGGQSYLSLKATNHFNGSTNSVIESYVTDLNLASTNGNLRIDGLLAPTVPKFRGTIDAWSGTWTNVYPDGTPVHFNVTVIDSHLDAEVDSLVQDMQIRSTNSLVISDAINVFHNLLLDTRRLTIATNAPGSPSPFGELNLLSGDFTWAANLPRLNYLTNNGQITSVGAISFTGERRPPYYPISFSEPYQAFINSGLIKTEGTEIWTRYYEETGTNTSGFGPLSVVAFDALMTNCVVQSTNADMTLLADSLNISNVALTVGRTLTLGATNLLNDGSLAYNNADFVTNRNVWNVGDGFSLIALPAQASLQGTTITSSIPGYVNGAIRWAGRDMGNNPIGFSNNAAIGRVILNGGPQSLYSFLPAGNQNAIYIDYLELKNSTATNRANDGTFLGLQVAAGMQVYFGQAVANGESIAEKLGQSPGFNWVSNYDCGTFSSTNIFYASDGVTNRMNAALASSCDIDSNTNGIVNCMDPEPIPGPFPNCNVPTGLPVNAPVVNFAGSPLSGEAPLNVSFNNLTTGATNYLWAFGDGGTSTAVNPAHSYGAAGIYGVTLTAWGHGGANSLSRDTYVAVSTGDVNGGGGGGGVKLAARPSVGGTNTVPDIFDRSQGSYQGLFYNSNGVNAASAGYFTARTTARGTYSARLSIGGKSYPLSGQFDQKSGRASGSVKRAAGPLQARLQLDLSGAGQIVGHVSGSGISAELFADRAAKREARNYTLVIPAPSSPTNSALIPRGAGYAAVKVNSKGGLVMSGTLADGSKFSQKSAVSEQGIWPVYSSPYRGGGGLVVSWVQFSGDELGGHFVWLKPAGALGANYTSGFTVDTETLGSAYQRPASGSGILDFSVASLRFDGAGLNLNSSITLGANNKGSDDGGRLSLSLVSSSGLFKGNAYDPGSGANVNFQGAVLQQTDRGRGFFLRGNQSGGVELLPAP